MKKILLVAVFFFNLLLTTPIVQASQEIAPQELVGFEITDSATYDTTMSKEELYVLPGYVEAEREPTVPEDFPVGDRLIAGGTAIEPSTWINIPYPAPVDVMIVVDDDMKSSYEYIVKHRASWSEIYDWANNILEAGDDPFYSEFEIDFVTREYRQWNSPSGSLSNLLVWGQQAFPKPSGIDVTVIMTGQNTFPEGGRAEMLGDAFVMTVAAAGYLMPLANLWQHEASHLYGATDISDFWAALFTVCIMSYIWAPVTRSWHSDHWQTIYSNRLRYGYYYKTIWIY